MPFPFAWFKASLGAPNHSPETLATREVVVIGLVFAVVFRITLLLTTPSLSDDIYRYIWDGRVSNIGLNPFQYAPNDDRLQQFQDADYFPKINHKEISTIYPPVSQLVFAALYKIKPTVFGFKLGFLLFDLLTLTALLFLLQSLRIDLRRSLIYAWNPLVIVEFSGSAHADIIGIFFLTAALWLLVIKKVQWCNFLLVLSILTKFISLLFLPVIAYLKKRNRILVLLLFIIFTAALYLPYAGAGKRLFSGFLVYSDKWQFNASTFSLILEIVKSHLPTSWVVDFMITPHGYQADPETIATRTLDLALIVTKVIVGGVFAGIYGYYMLRLGRDLRRKGRRWIFHLGLIFFGSLFLLNPTVQPWYLCWLLPFLVVVPNRAFLLLTGLVALSYWILIDYTATGVWREATWAKWVQYLPFYCLLIYESLAVRLRNKIR